MEQPGNNKPLYLQTAEWIMDGIIGGEYGPDSRIPSVRETAASQQINIGTVQKSYEYLSQCGVIYNRRGMGYYVQSDGAQRVAWIRETEFLTRDMDYIFGRLHSFGMTPDRLAQLFNEYLKRK